MKTENKSSGIGFITLLQLAFIILKLCNVIDMSWWWVMSPAWITALVTLAFVLLIAVCIIHDKYVDYKSVKKRKDGEHK